MKIYHQSAKFHHDAAKKNFTVEMSTLDEGGRRNVFGRIYNDACDEGFVMISTRTGHESVWAVSLEQRDSEGEMEAWILYPTTETLRKIPALKGYKVTIFND